MAKVSQHRTVVNKQVERTRSWIFEALIALLDEKPYSKITIQDITAKAGIARQTFYRNYTDKDACLFEYLANTINTKFIKIEKEEDAFKQSVITLAFDYTYMIKNQVTLKKILSIEDIANRVMRDTQMFPLSLIKDLKNTLSNEDFLVCRYKIYYQLVGVLRVFLDWFLHDMPLPVKKFVSMLNAMCVPQEPIYKHIPTIKITML